MYFIVCDLKSHMVEIKYLCTCTKFLPFAELYFCRHCVKLKCKNCVLSEIDSYYCPHCLENVPSTEAKLKDNRCLNCYQCPICNNPLYSKTLRTKSTDNVNREASLPYLFCEVCLWNNKNITLYHNNDMEVSGYNDFGDIKLNDLISYYQNMKNISFFNNSVRFPKSKYFMDTIQIKNLMGNNPNNIVNVANEKFECDYEDKTKILLYQLKQTNSINLFSTLDQKLRNVVQQPMMAINLQPSNLHFSVRLVARCNECEHYIIKPELKPGNLHFKIDQMAMYYIPQLEVIYPPDYYAQVLSETESSTEDNIIFIIKNMSAYPRNVAIKGFDLKDALKDIKENCSDKIDFDQAIDSLESSFKTNFQLEIPEMGDLDGFALSKMPNDIETLTCFQPLNLNLAHCIKKRALPNNTVLYHQLNRVALKLRVRNALEDDKANAESEVEKSPRCCYLTLTHNYSNPTLFVNSANTSLASSIKDKTMNVLGSLVGTNVSGKEDKEEKIPEIILKHVIRIAF